MMSVDRNSVPAEPVISVRGLAKRFPVRDGLSWFRPAGEVRAIDGLDFDIRRGETLGLVGESGCGKTTTSRVLLRLLDASAGEIRFNGQRVEKLSGKALRDFRKNVQIVFQDPYASLDPRMRVEQLIAEPLVTSTKMTRSERQARVVELMEMVGLPKQHIQRFPHQFSGGQRQRIGIARALALNPTLLVCDEPVSALDISIQAQIVNLLQDLQQKLGIAILFVAHDLQVVRHISHRIGVMYLGRMVELGDAQSVFNQPVHPYTQLLFASAPRLLGSHAAPSDSGQFKSEIPSPLAPPSGCHFHPRCPFATEVCREQVPLLREVSGRDVLCHHAERTQAAYSNTAAKLPNQ